MMNKLPGTDLLIKRYLKYPFFKLFCLAGNISDSFQRKKILQRGKISRILVIQVGGIGDIIRMFPSLISLSKEFPAASIYTLTQFGDNILSFLPNHSEIISGNIIFEPKGKHRSIMNKLALAMSLRNESFHLIFSPNYGLGMIEFSIIAYIIGAPYRIGYNYNGAGFLYTSKIELREDIPIMLQHLNLLTNSGIKASLGEGEEWFRVSDADMSFAKTFLNRYKTSTGDLLIAIAPVTIADRDYKSPMHRHSLVDYRAWSEDRFIELINNIIYPHKARVVILGDKIPNGHLSEYLKSSNNPNLINTIGMTTIGQSAALIKQSDIFIGNDSGLLHIAVALKKRCIGIFGSTSPIQVIPSADYFIPLWKGLECSPCFIHEPIPDFKCERNIECLRTITVEDVMNAIISLLQN